VIKRGDVQLRVIPFIGKRADHLRVAFMASVSTKTFDKLTIVSGHDTTIEGAQLKGNQVIADIGNNLTIRSE
jgi:filamentous hemagglutinin